MERFVIVAKFARRQALVSGAWSDPGQVLRRARGSRAEGAVAAGPGRGNHAFGVYLAPGEAAVSKHVAADLCPADGIDRVNRTVDPTTAEATCPRGVRRPQAGAAARPASSRIRVTIARSPFERCEER